MHYILLNMYFFYPTFSLLLSYLLLLFMLFGSHTQYDLKDICYNKSFPYLEKVMLPVFSSVEYGVHVNSTSRFVVVFVTCVYVIFHHTKGLRQKVEMIVLVFNLLRKITKYIESALKIMCLYMVCYATLICVAYEKLQYML